MSFLYNNANLFGYINNHLYYLHRFFTKNNFPKDNCLCLTLFKRDDCDYIWNLCQYYYATDPFIRMSQISDNNAAYKMVDIKIDDPSIMISCVVSPMFGNGSELFDLSTNCYKEPAIIAHDRYSCVYTIGDFYGPKEKSYSNDSDYYLLLINDKHDNVIKPICAYPLYVYDADDVPYHVGWEDENQRNLFSNKFFELLGWFTLKTKISNDEIHID